MLDNTTIKKIEDFVYAKPRSIQELAQHLNKNWRTADRYIQEIQENFGTIATRTFREGTRGALKIIYWASVEKISSSIFQEKLEQEIFSAKKKEEFSAFDIFQHVPDKSKKAIIEKAITENSTNLQELVKLFKETKKQLTIFSGDLSLVNLKKGKIDLFKELEKLVKRNIKIKIICRVDIVGKANVERTLSLNFKHGKELIEIKHYEHPIRAFIFDNQIIRIKEIKEPTGKIKELDKKIFIFYTIRDSEWGEWLSKIFWKMFNQSISANKRTEELKKLKLVKS